MRTANDWRGVRIYTVGHSTRSLDELVTLLRAAGVSVLVDIRTIPRSRHNPQFNRDALRVALRSRQLRYVHLPALGGLRRARPDSPNAGWRNASFRGYADYMLTEDFEAGLGELRALAQNTAALMCAEAVPWRCHRSLVADALAVRGAQVEHITGTGHARPHHLTSFARVDGTRVTYPGEAPEGASLAVRAPFHLEATVRVLQRRPTNLVDVWVDDRYRRALMTPGGLALVEVSNEGTVDKPDVRYRVLRGKRSARVDAAVERSLRRMLGMDVDPRPLRRLVEAEQRLHHVAPALRGMRPPRFAGLFETFARVVPFQQVSLDAGVAVVSRLVERFGPFIEYDGNRVHAFPEASAIADSRISRLRACGVSARKAETLRNVARAIESGEVSEEKLARMDSLDASRCLTEISGIGPWSAHLILLRGMGRLDVFPPGDVGAARGLSKLLRLPSGRSLTPTIERFGEHRGYLYFCALGGALLARGLIHAAPARGRPRLRVKRG
jgi:3-methyladenine DNA glycosylase/8-oxoguanine DNA glycosylase